MASRRSRGGAERAGVETLHLTVDTAVTGIRERDARNGFRAATRISPRMGLGMAMRPAWVFDMMRTGKPASARCAGGPSSAPTSSPRPRRSRASSIPALSWADVDWLRQRWKGRLSIKGILDPEDARRAKAAGADAIVVSNHGGRQLDGAPSTISALPAVVEAADGMEVLLDGGVRRGTDIVKAVALGASGVLLGRAYVWGVAAGGEAGAARVIRFAERGDRRDARPHGPVVHRCAQGAGRDALAPCAEPGKTAATLFSLPKRQPNHGNLDALFSGVLKHRG